MSEEKKEAGEETKTEGAEAPKGKSSSKMLIIVGAVVGLVVLAGVPIAISKMKAPGTVATNVAIEIPQDQLHPVGHDETGAAEDLELNDGETPLGAVAPLDPFVANLKGGRFLRLQFQAVFSDKDIPSRWTTRSALLRDAVVVLLTKYRADDILADDGITVLKKQIKDVLNEALKKDLVQDILVTQIVVQ